MPPSSPPSRRFTLIDAMILVAAAALGFAGVRAELTRHLHPSTTYHERPFDPPPLPVAASGRTTVNATVSGSFSFSS